MSEAASISAPTVDPNELETYNNLGPEWWDKNGIMKFLHSGSILNVKLVQDYFIDGGYISEELIGTERPLKDKLILDVGCGGGILSEPLAQVGATVTGIDVNATLIDVAQQHATLNPSLTNLTYLLESIEDHSAANPGKYDLVFANFVLEHVNNQELFLEACVKCVKPGGSIFVTCMGKTMMCWLVAIVLYENIARIMPRGTHDWDKFITAEDTKQILEKYNCRESLVRGEFHNMFTNNWSLIENTSVFYIVGAIKDK